MIDSLELINAIFAYNWVNYIFSWKTLICMFIVALIGAAILGEQESGRVKFILSMGQLVSLYIVSVIATSTLFSGKKNS